MIGHARAMRSFGGALKTFFLVVCVLLISTSAFSAGRGWSGNVNGYFAFTDLNSAWDFSTGEGAQALDLDVSNPWQYGVQLDLNHTTRVGDHWPISLFMGIYSYGKTADDALSNGVTGGTENTLTEQNVSVSLDIIEVDFGFRKYIGRDEDQLLPWFGAGLAVLLLDLSRDTTTVTSIAPPGTQLWVPSRIDFVSSSEQETLLGAWLSLGLMLRPWDWLNLGAEARYLYTGTAFETDDRIASWNLGVLAGYHF